MLSSEDLYLLGELLDREQDMVHTNENLLPPEQVAFINEPFKKRVRLLERLIDAAHNIDIDSEDDYARHS